MAATAPLSNNIPHKPQSCVRCAARKVRCDRKRPCDACIRHNVDCIYKPLERPRNRNKHVKDQMVTERLKLYETLLRENGIDPTKLTGNFDTTPPQRIDHDHVTNLMEHNPLAPTSRRLGVSQNIKKARVIRDQDNFQVVDNPLWSRMVEDLQDVQAPREGVFGDTNDAEASDDDADFVLGFRLNSFNKYRHPAPESISQLWHIFVENVDPLIKVLHVPTLQPAIEKAVSDNTTIPDSFTALLFAIYSASVMSLKDAECRERLREPRKLLLTRYLSGTKAALSRSNFMGSTSLVTLQALVLHLISARDVYEPRVFWSLTGVAVRIAQGMGLDRDGTTLELAPFETEIRRRIWWLLKTHDFRAAELCGMNKFQELHVSAGSTDWPSNLNDDELYPAMSALVSRQDTVTDAVFICLKCEFVKFVASRMNEFSRQGKTSEQWQLHTPGNDTAEIDQSFGEIVDLLETKYLRYCDPSQPLHLMAMLVVRCSMNNMRFLSRHPRRWASIEQTPLSERQWVWEICIKLLEQHDMLQSSPQLKRFAWYGAYFQQWYAIIHVLDTLRIEPQVVHADKAWKLIGGIYENNADMVSDTRKPIHRAVGNLCLKAHSAREVAIRNRNEYTPPVPQFIKQLRRQRGDAERRREARFAQGNEYMPPISHGQTESTQVYSRKDSDAVNFDSSLDSLPDHPSTIGNDLSFGQNDGAAAVSGTDPIWSTWGFDDSQGGKLNDVTSIDMDFVFDQDGAPDNNVMQSITWEQWDSWLAESNLMRPVSDEDFGITTSY